jgi:arylsulfatase A-like enzyme
MGFTKRRLPKFIQIIIKHPIEITDVTATILESLDIPIPDDIDGANFVKWS